MPKSHWMLVVLRYKDLNRRFDYLLLFSFLFFFWLLRAVGRDGYPGHMQLGTHPDLENAFQMEKVQSIGRNGFRSLAIRNKSLVSRNSL